MKVKRMGVTEILRRIWLFSANKIKRSNLWWRGGGGVGDSLPPLVEMWLTDLPKSGGW